MSKDAAKEQAARIAANGSAAEIRRIADGLKGHNEQAEMIAARFAGKN